MRCEDTDAPTGAGEYAVLIDEDEDMEEDFADTEEDADSQFWVDSPKSDSSD